MNDAEIHALAVSIEDGEWFDDTQDMLKFAALVRNAALEEATKSCNELIEADNSDDYKAGVTWCAMRIEGMKS